MLSSLIERIQKDNEERMGKIYAECDSRGFPRRYADAFYFRLIQYPIAHTKNVLALKESKNKYFDIDSISKLKTLLEIMIISYPESEKLEEWKQCLELIKKEG